MLSFCSEKLKIKTDFGQDRNKMQAMDIAFPFTLILISVPYSVGACREMEYIWDK